MGRKIMDEYNRKAINLLNEVMKYADFKRVVSIDCFAVVTEHETRLISVDVSGEVKEVVKL